MASASSEASTTPRTSIASSRPTASTNRMTYFPLGYKEAFSQWWAGLTPKYTEYKVLSFIPYIQKPAEETHSEPVSSCSSRTNVSKVESNVVTTVASNLTKTSSIEDPYGPRRWFLNLVKLSGKDRALNEFSVERVDEPVENDLVMLHGYGAGLGFFYQNFEPLSRLPGWRLYALDLLGMGRSSRPPFRIYAKDKEGKIQEAESWFVDALEEWRKIRNIEKFTLLGHSMGGYMAVAYALKYPGRLKKLILVSPVGIPEDPNAVNADLPEPQSSTFQNEFTQSQEDLTATSNTKVEVKAPRRQMSKWFTYLWDANVSPFSLVRLSGPFGPSLVSGWTSRRFSHLSPPESQALHDYAYSLFRQRGSGEYVLAYILAPGAFARSPLIQRIQGVGRQLLTPHAGPTVDGDMINVEAKRENGIPVVMMYGEHDWMDVTGGIAAQKKILDAKRKALKGKSTAERTLDQGDAKVVIVPKSGHHIYLDNPQGFNDEMILELRDVQRREKASKK